MSEPFTPEPNASDVATVLAALESGASGATDPSDARTALENIQTSLQDANDRVIIAQAHDKQVSTTLDQLSVDYAAKVSDLQALELTVTSLTDQYEELQTNTAPFGNALQAISFMARSVRGLDETKKSVALDVIAGWAEDPKKAPGDFATSVKGLLGAKP